MMNGPTQKGHSGKTPSYGVAIGKRTVSLEAKGNTAISLNYKKKWKADSYGTGCLSGRMQMATSEITWSICIS